MIKESDDESSHSKSAPEMESLKILMTEGSSTSARQALYVLGPRHTIDILDPSALCQCRFSRLVRRWYRCPSFSKEPEAYLEFLVQRLRADRYDVLFPTHEQVYLLARFRDELCRLVGVALPQFDTLDQVIGKANFVRTLDKLGLPQPETTIVSNRAALLETNDFPCYVKVAHSTASDGVRLVRDQADLRKVADQFERAGWLDGSSEIVVQQLATGQKAGIAGVFQHGRLVASHGTQLRFPNAGGWSVGVESVSNPQALNHLKQLGEHLNWHGAMGLEYFYDPATGRPQFFECNPRVGETVNAMLSGVDFAETLVRVSLDEDVEPLAPGREGVRSHQGFLILMAMAHAGATRRELFGELWRRWRRNDFYQKSEDELTRAGEDLLSVIPALAVSTQLLIRPGAARRIVKNTVDNYSLSEVAARTIRQLSAEQSAQLFRLGQHPAQRTLDST